MFELFLFKKGSLKLWLMSLSVLMFVMTLPLTAMADNGRHHGKHSYHGKYHSDRSYRHVRSHDVFRSNYNYGHRHHYRYQYYYPYYYPRSGVYFNFGVPITTYRYYRYQPVYYSNNCYGKYRNNWYYGKVDRRGCMMYWKNSRVPLSRWYYIDR